MELFNWFWPNEKDNIIMKLDIKGSIKYDRDKHRNNFGIEILSLLSHFFKNSLIGYCKNEKNELDHLEIICFHPRFKINNGWDKISSEGFINRYTKFFTVLPEIEKILKREKINFNFKKICHFENTLKEFQES